MPKGIEFNEAEGHHIWFAVEKYEDILKHDLDTKYDGDPRWQEDEDGPFLREQISRCEHVLTMLQEHDMQPMGTESHPLGWRKV